MSVSVHVPVQARTVPSSHIGVFSLWGQERTDHVQNKKQLIQALLKYIKISESNYDTPPATFNLENDNYTIKQKLYISRGSHQEYFITKNGNIINKGLGYKVEDDLKAGKLYGLF